MNKHIEKIKPNCRDRYGEKFYNNLKRHDFSHNLYHRF